MGCKPSQHSSEAHTAAAVEMIHRPVAEGRLGVEGLTQLV